MIDFRREIYNDVIVRRAADISGISNGISARVAERKRKAVSFGEIRHFHVHDPIPHSGQKIVEPFISGSVLDHCSVPVAQHRLTRIIKDTDRDKVSDPVLSKESDYDTDDFSFFPSVCIDRRVEAKLPLCGHNRCQNIRYSGMAFYATLIVFSLGDIRLHTDPTC